MFQSIFPEIMWSKFIPIFMFVSLLSGCLDGSGPNNAYEFAVFLGQKVTPDFSEISEGEIYGGKRSLIVSNKFPVGEINAIFDNDEKSSYSGVSPIMLFKNRGSLRIEGMPSNMTYVFALRYLSKDSWELVYKSALPASEKFAIEFLFNSETKEINVISEAKER